MTDTKKCGRFVVKIQDHEALDTNCVVFCGRPSDVCLLTILDIIPTEPNLCHYQVLSKSSEVALNLEVSVGGRFTGWVAYCYPRRFSKRAPYRILKRCAWEFVSRDLCLTRVVVEELRSRLHGERSMHVQQI